MNPLISLTAAPGSNFDELIERLKKEGSREPTDWEKREQMVSHVTAELDWASREVVEKYFDDTYGKIA